MKSPTNARMKVDIKEKVDQNARKIKNVCMENVCPNVSQAVEIMTLVLESHVCQAFNVKMEYAFLMVFVLMILQLY